MPKYLLLLLLIFLSISISQAQDSSCVPNLRFEYDSNSDSLLLINTRSSEVLQSYPEIRRYDLLEHSPDCRFVVATLWRNYLGNEVIRNGIVGDTTVWDANTGQQLQIFEDARTRPHHLVWSPDSERLIVGTRNGYYLWDFFNDEHVQVSRHPLEDWWLQVEWDTETTQVFVMAHTYFDSDDEVLVFNWLSGEEITRYGFGEMSFRAFNESSYRVLDDYVLVYRMGTSQEFMSPVAVWNRSNHQLMYLLNAQDAGPQGKFNSWQAENPSSGRIDISPDGRYLVIGFRALRVWDLWNLAPEFEDRIPIHTFGISARGIQQVRFIDEIHVEIELYDNSLIRINIETGEPSE